MFIRKPFLLAIGVVTLLLSGFVFIAVFPYAISPEQHCVFSPMPAQGSLNESAIQPSGIRKLHCFNTFAEAIEYATGGKVHLDSAIKPSDVTDEMLNPDLYKFKNSPEQPLAP